MSEPKHDDDPRAWEVVSASARVPGWDPSRRWERPDTPPPEVRAFVENLPLRLDPDHWEAQWRPLDFTVREYEAPPQLIADLGECVPQAFLRDLHRPVAIYGALFEPSESFTGGWREPLREAREAMQVRAPLRPIEPTVQAMAADQARRGAFFAEPWQPLLDDDAPRRRVQLYLDDE